MIPPSSSQVGSVPRTQEPELEYASEELKNDPNLMMTAFLLDGTPQGATRVSQFWHEISVAPQGDEAKQQEIRSKYIAIFKSARPKT